jgi:hypothetical protein
MKRLSQLLTAVMVFLVSGYAAASFSCGSQLTYQNQQTINLGFGNSLTIYDESGEFTCVGEGEFVPENATFGRVAYVFQYSNGSSLGYGYNWWCGNVSGVCHVTYE